MAARRGAAHAARTTEAARRGCALPAGPRPAHAVREPGPAVAGRRALRGDPGCSRADSVHRWAGGSSVWRLWREGGNPGLEESGRCGAGARGQSSGSPGHRARVQRLLRVSLPHVRSAGPESGLQAPRLPRLVRSLCCVYLRGFPGPSGWSQGLPARTGVGLL